MTDLSADTGRGKEPCPHGLMTTAQIAHQYGITYSAVRQWRLEPYDVIVIGDNRRVRRYCRAKVEAYATSQRRLNRLPKPKI